MSDLCIACGKVFGGRQHADDMINSSAEKDKKTNSEVMYVWRGINLTMAVFFLLATYVNINDDDWYLWVPVYLFPGVLSLPLVFKPDLADTKFWSNAMVVHLTLCCAYALYQIVLLIDALGSRIENPLQHEEGREMGGLLILITWLGISRFTDIGRPNKNVTTKGYMSALLLMTITLTILPLFIWSLCFISDWHTKLGHCSGMFS